MSRGLHNGNQYKWIEFSNIKSQTHYYMKNHKNEPTSFLFIWKYEIGFSFLLHADYPITPFKGPAPLSGSIKNSTIFWKTKSSKKSACALFLALIFRYKTDIFQHKKKLHIDLKKKK